MIALPRRSRCAPFSFAAATAYSAAREFKLAFALSDELRNTTAHEAKIKWPIEEDDALDILSMLSLVHRKLDRAIKVPRSSP
jgi:hypothetical protein